MILPVKNGLITKICTAFPEKTCIRTHQLPILFRFLVATKLCTKPHNYDRAYSLVKRKDVNIRVAKAWTDIYRFMTI